METFIESILCLCLLNTIVNDGLSISVPLRKPKCVAYMKGKDLCHKQCRTSAGNAGALPKVCPYLAAVIELLEVSLANAVLAVAVVHVGRVVVRCWAHAG